LSSVSFEHVTKVLGDVTAVDDLTLDIVDGEFMVLLGPSGSGKTTVLRLIAGLETVTRGEVRIGGRVVNDVEAKNRNVAMVFQSYALYPHMTVAKNVESPLVSRHIPVPGEAVARRLTHAERQERVREAADLLGLTELLGRKPAALSGGQRQRVALARAIVSRPAAFLMDEPLSNLDAQLRAQTRLELAEMQRRLATTFVYVTHDQVEAMTMATRLAILDRGRLQQVGSPRDVYGRPANLFVARFIGNPPMNALPATVVVDRGEAFLDVGAGRLRAWAEGALVDGTKVVVGVRPEDVSVGRGGLEATVRAVEWLGHELQLVCDVADTSVVVRTTSHGPEPAMGTRVALACDPKALHLFDFDTGERVP
jgi:ABC-type sugar transport system ATPase subunit